MSEGFAEAVAEIGSPLLDVLVAMDQIARRVEPGALPRLRELLAPRATRLAREVERFRSYRAPEELAPLAHQLLEAAEIGAEASRLLVEPGPEEGGATRVLDSLRLHTRAQESLYPLHAALPPVARYFTEPELHGRLDELAPEPPPDVGVGLFSSAGSEAVDERGGFFLYVPETYDGTGDWPLIVALHGGHGHGRSFLWTWLREARSRRALLVAPTSIGPTWSFHGPDVDRPALLAVVEAIADRWRVDRSRLLLTGLSDGATYALYCGLQDGSPFTTLAPLSGVLHPGLLADGGIIRARGRRIYLVHGARDWMFPVAMARLARETLEKAGAELVYREIPDLAHAYAREENARILDWFGLPVD